VQRRETRINKHLCRVSCYTDHYSCLSLMKENDHIKSLPSHDYVGLHASQNPKSHIGRRLFLCN